MRKMTRKSLRELAVIMTVIPKSIMAMMFIINTMPVNGSQISVPEDTLCAPGGKWHPKMFHVVLPDLSLRFILPYEPDQSGFYNLFFISKESGETLLLDTIKEKRRYFYAFSSGKCYDVVLLYNNGKYIRHNDLLFEKEVEVEVDMSNQHIQPSDSLSEHWKTMRSFDNVINDRTLKRDDIAVSDFIIKGYVISDLVLEQYPWLERKAWTFEPTVQLIGTNVKSKTCTIDGYFIFDIEEETIQTLKVFASGHSFNKEINITASCGLFLVMRGFGRARRE